MKRDLTTPGPNAILLDVGPPPPAYNEVCERRADSVLRRYSLEPGTGAPSGTYVSDILIGKSGGVVRSSLRRVVHNPSSPLLVHVSRVLKRRPGKQVIRVAADGIIACVADKETVRVTPGKDERKAMDVISPPVESERTISAFLPISGPLPALVIAGDHTATQGAREAAITLIPLHRNEIVTAHRTEFTNHVPS